MIHVFPFQITTRWQTWQVDRSILQITSILGEGNFGSVYLGSLPDQYMPGMFVQVAVKTIKVCYFIFTYIIYSMPKQIKNFTSD